MNSSQSAARGTSGKRIGSATASTACRERATTARYIGRFKMAVYVDDMKAGYGRMKMCHMLADSDEELHAMAARIGVARRWHQKSGTPQSHYDICLSKRALAVQFGAQKITQRQAGLIVRWKREALTRQGEILGARNNLLESNPLEGFK